MRYMCCISAMVVVLAAQIACAASVADLRLVPFPKEIESQQGAFSLREKLFLDAPAADIHLLGRLVGEELRRAGLPAPELRPLEGKDQVLRLVPQGTHASPPASFRKGATAEDYTLTVRPNGVHIAAVGREGLLHAAQTLCQLLRANRSPEGLMCLSIRDWPSLRWRCFQDDLTRGPAAKLDTLRSLVALAPGSK